MNFRDHERRAARRFWHQTPWRSCNQAMQGFCLRCFWRDATGINRRAKAEHLRRMREETMPLLTPVRYRRNSETGHWELTEFLLARITEDERSLAPLAHLADIDGDPMQANIRRSLAIVEAHRRIVERCAALLDAFPDGTITRREKHLAQEVLAALAQPHADHPGYRQEWRP